MSRPQTKTPHFPDAYYQDPYGLDRYVVQEKILHQWRSPSKIEKKWSAAERTQLFLVILFFGIVLLLLGEVAVAAIMLLLCGLYTLFAITPPTQIECQITTIGLKVADKYFFWQDMSQFWWEEKSGQNVLYARVVYPMLQNLRLIIPQPDEEMVQKTMGTYLLYKQPQQTQLQKAIKKIIALSPIDLEFLRL